MPTYIEVSAAWWRNTESRSETKGVKNAKTPPHPPHGRPWQPVLRERLRLPQAADRNCRKPFFYWAARSIEKYVDCADLTFVVLEEHIRDFAIDAKIKAYWPNARIIALPAVTEGAAITALRGAEASRWVPPRPERSGGSGGRVPAAGPRPKHRRQHNAAPGRDGVGVSR